MFEDIIFSVIPYDTRKKSNRQKIGDGLFLYQVYTCESGCCNRQMSTRSVSSIQFFTRVCNFLFVTFWPPFLSLFKSSIKLKSPPPYYSIVIWNRFNLLYNIYVKFGVIFIWSINAAQCHPYPINVNIKYYVSTIWVAYIFMEINWNTSVDQNAGSTWVACTMWHKNIARPLIFPVTFGAKGRVTFLQ